MKQGKELILATKPFAKEIRSKSWFYTISTLVVLIATNAVAFLPVPILVKIPFSVLNGLVIVRMFVIYHDQQHHTILHKSKLADAIFTVFGIYILAPTSIWKRSHDYHHAHNSKLFSASIGSYPIFSKQKFMSSSRGEQRTYLFVRHPLTISFGYIFMFMYGMCIQSFMNNKEKHKDSLVALILHAALIFCITYFFGWKVLLLAVFIPFLVSGALGAYLFYAQHNFPGVTFKDNVDWDYEHAAMESSSYIKMNAFWRWVTANIGYHHIHHMNARIPFYRLPEAMESIPELQKVTTITLNPMDIIRCFRLKVWDPEANRMISAKGLAAA